MIKSNLNGEGCRMFSNLLDLQTISKLKNNWDGYNAPKIPKRVIRIVSTVIKNLKVQPEIFPTTRKSLQLEYHRGENYLEIEVFKHKVNVYIESNATCYSYLIKRNNIQNLIDNFLLVDNLHSMVPFVIINQGKDFIASYKPLGIEVCAKSMDDAIESFQAELDMLWKQYVLEEDKKLSKDALLLKQKILQISKKSRFDNLELGGLDEDSTVL